MNENETTLEVVFLGTPPDYEDALIDIRSVNGTKRITNERLAEIVDESRRLGKLGRGGTNQQCAKIFDRLIEEEVAHGAACPKHPHRLLRCYQKPKRSPAAALQRV